MDSSKRDRSSSREVDAAKLMIRVSNMHKRAVDRLVVDFGVPRSQHRLLMHIERMGSASSQAELAKQLDVSGATVAVMPRISWLCTRTMCGVTGCIGHPRSIRWARSLL